MRVAQIGGESVAIFTGSSGNQGPIDRWALMVPDFRTLITAKNASFFGDFREARYRGKNGTGNEESLAAIRVQNSGRQDWRIGRNFPRIFRKSRTDHWELMAPDSRTLIAAKNASFFGDFRRAGIGVEMDPEMRHAYPRLGSRMWVAQIGGGLVAIFPGSPGNHGPIVGN